MLNPVGIFVANEVAGCGKIVLIIRMLRHEVGIICFQSVRSILSVHKGKRSAEVILD
jgi:hypothetical protein